MTLCIYGYHAVAEADILHRELAQSGHQSAQQALLARNERVRLEDLRCVREEREASAFVKEDYGSDTIRLESIRPSLLLSDGQPSERNVTTPFNRRSIREWKSTSPTSST